MVTAQELKSAIDWLRDARADRALGQLQTAALAADRALAALASAPPDARAAALVERGQIAREAGHLCRAESWLVEAVALSNEAEAVALRRRATNELAMTVQARGRPDEARDLLVSALEAHDGPRALALVINLGAALLALGDDEEASGLLRSISPADLNVEDRPKLLVYTAALERNSGDLVTARRLLQEALEVRVRLKGRGHPDTLSTRLNLAVILHEQGALDAAERQYRDVLHERTARLGGGHDGTIRAMSNLAALLRARGEDREAIDLLEEAVHRRRTEPGQGEAGRGLSIALHNLAFARMIAGAPSRAAGPALEGASLIEARAQKILPTLAFAEQRAYTARFLRRKASLYLALAESAPHRVREFADIVLTWRGTLFEAVQRQAALLRGAPPSVRAQLLDVRGAMIRAQYRTGEPRARREHERRKESLERSLSASIDAPPWARTGVRDLQAALPRDGALVEIVRHGTFDDSGNVDGRVYSAFIVWPGGVRLARIDDAHRLDAIALAWLDARFDAESREAEAVWAPIAGQLPDSIRRAWVVPDGALYRIPWTSVALGATIEVGPSLSASDLVQSLTGGIAPAPAPGRALVIGDVDYGKGSDDADRWERLRATPEEIERVGALAEEAGLDPVVLDGGLPTRERTLSCLEAAAFVHMATHADLQTDSRPPRSSTAGWPLSSTSSTYTRLKAGGRSPLLAGALVLAAANSDQAAVVTAEDIVGLDLRGVRLATLSACETGLGTEEAGQSVLGLSLAVRSAGARAVLVSLWEVPDSSTEALMGAFYDAYWRAGETVHEALATAQRFVRSQTRWKAPVHWAAWVVLGAGGSRAR